MSDIFTNKDIINGDVDDEEQPHESIPLIGKEVNGSINGSANGSVNGSVNGSSDDRLKTSCHNGNGANNRRLYIKQNGGRQMTQRNGNGDQPKKLMTRIRFGSTDTYLSSSNGNHHWSDSRLDECGDDDQHNHQRSVTHDNNAYNHPSIACRRSSRTVHSDTDLTALLLTTNTTTATTDDDDDVDHTTTNNNTIISNDNNTINGDIAINGVMNHNPVRKSVSIGKSDAAASAVNGQNQSRFQVAKVSDDDNGDDDNNSSDDTIHDMATIGGHHMTVDYTTTYDTKNVKSLRYYTREALPRVDNYRNILSVHRHMTRPTLDELHGVQTTIHPDPNNKAKLGDKLNGDISVETAVKFGWIKGVLVRCLLNIWGVMLFMRLAWVGAQAGIGLGSVVIILATIVTTVTSISMSAICTNGEVKGGGTYYMISRSLGPEFGGAIGIIFSIANAVAVAMYSVGFAEAMRDLLMDNGLALINGGMNDIRIISSLATIAMLGIALVGTEWEAKAQIILLFVLLVAMGDFFIGSLIPPSVEKQSKGFVGWSGQVLVDNFMPRFEGQSFFTVFSVFFPAATGILAGANISGDLKDPQTSIPKGTLLAIGITTFSYLLFLFICGGVVTRDANGLTELLFANSSGDYLNLIQNCTINGNTKCEYGSSHNYQIVELVSIFGPIIYAGIFAATLSSALASLVSAPKVFQALCKDKLFPYIEYFGHGFGKNNEPRRGYLLAFGLAIACCLIGDLNSIAPLISNFFLAAYCLINFSCFHASFAKSPGFRPSFKYYNMWLSLMGAVLCLMVMFMTHWPAALGTFVIILGLYIWIQYRKPDVNWGSSTQAQTYLRALNSVYRLNLVPNHVKNFRPQILVLTGSPSSRPPIIDFSNTISKGIGLIICGHVVDGSLSQRARNALIQESNNYLQRRRIKGFYNLVEEESLAKGVDSMIQSVGVGKLRPNIVMMGMKSNWQTSDPEEISDYFNTIHTVFDRHLSLIVIRLSNGLDFSRFGDIPDEENEKEKPTANGLTPSAPYLNCSYVSIDVSKEDIASNGQLLSVVNISNRGSISSRGSTPSTPCSHFVVNGIQQQQHHHQQQQQLPHHQQQQQTNGSTNISENPMGMNGISKDIIPKEVMLAVNQFQNKQKKGFIDVWWLYDDGGLTLLLPYLLSTRKQWKGCKLRVFALANKKDELDTEQRNMATLLSKFRIGYSDVIVIADIHKPPQESTIREFDALISKWRVKESSDNTTNNCDPNTGDHNNTNDSDSNRSSNQLVITEDEVIALKDKNKRHMRLRELLCQYSRQSSLIVMTLPMPRKGTCSAPMYMSWLELLTQDMPPFMFIRGDQTNVLTFYS
ncbi:solute carrier family 12 member 1-like [Oppia nitens]|uniref:solute carrier family 12 member 1-like n=1 Tax=Oppia nitens TaxID=1686743 RepID=UPI0023DA0F10|nr:solute carrier family 12 member 1-like [Oppia nitens]